MGRKQRGGDTLAFGLGPRFLWTGMQAPDDNVSGLQGYCEDSELKGIIPRVIEMMFRCVDEAEDTVEFTLKASYVETGALAGIRWDIVCVCFHLNKNGSILPIYFKLHEFIYEKRNTRREKENQWSAANRIILVVNHS
jgi:hypothetical protein